MKRNLTGAHLKLIAIITMFIDHIGAIFITRYADSVGLVLTDDIFMLSGEPLEIAYVATRLIGRLAFPIFAFLIVEGVTHTRDIRNYLKRLGLFAIISEIPFNLVSSDHISNILVQNVFFTLFFAAFTIYILQEIELKAIQGNFFYQIAAITIMALIAHFSNADYGFYGFMFIILIYTFRNKPINQAIVIAIMGAYQLTGALSGLFAYLYNGKRGNQWNKYFFYLFYPLHMLLIYGITKLII